MYRIAFAGIQGGQKLDAMKRMFSGTGIAYDDLEKAKVVMTEFVQLCNVVRGDSNNFYYAVVMVVNMVSGKIEQSQVIG